MPHLVSSQLEKSVIVWTYLICNVTRKHVKYIQRTWKVQIFLNATEKMTHPIARHNSESCNATLLLFSCLTATGMVWRFIVREVLRDDIKSVGLSGKSGCFWPTASFNQLVFEASPAELSWQLGLATGAVAEARIESNGKKLIKKLRRRINIFCMHLPKK